MRIAMVAARFSDAEVNELQEGDGHLPPPRHHRPARGEDGRRAWSRAAMTATSPQRCFNQIKGFGEYGFPESHAASFAHLVYVSSWLKCHYPAAFACALLNSQPMGFYAPAQIVRDAREHGVEVRPVDVNLSDWDCTLEPGGAECGAAAAAARSACARSTACRRRRRGVRIQVRRPAAERIPSRRRARSVAARRRAASPTLEKLAAADAFRSLGLDRRQALWEVKALAARRAAAAVPWSETRESRPEPAVALPAMPLSEHVVNDYQTLRLSLKAHPMSFLRERLRGAAA